MESQSGKKGVERMSLQEIITEKELMELLDVEEGTMYQLRLKGLPFTRLNRTKRVYLVKEVLIWIENNKTISTGSVPVEDEN
jgi:hypothetical protein